MKKSEPAKKISKSISASKRRALAASSVKDSPKPFFIKPSLPPEKFSAPQEIIEKGHFQQLPLKDTAQKTKPEFIENLDLPVSYNQTYLTLIPRDPSWIYAYWEVVPSAFSELRNKIGDEVDRCARVIRMYDVTCIDFNGNNANSWFDIDVGPHSNNWYINLWKDGISCCADFGLRAHDGRFYSLARSNFAQMPRAGVSWRSEKMWLEVKNDLPQPPFLITENRKKNSGNRHNSRRKIFLTEDDIRAYYSKLFPLLKNILSKRFSGLRGRALRLSLKGGISLDDILMRGASGKRLRRILLGASEEMLIAEGGSVREEKARRFFFEIGTELIVYGRTEPDAEVWLGDKKIKLRPDGTFTLRLALPDGKIPLDFIAVSKDKVEKRKITTSVERAKTIYEP